MSHQIFSLSLPVRRSERRLAAAGVAVLVTAGLLTLGSPEAGGHSTSPDVDIDAAVVSELATDGTASFFVTLRERADLSVPPGLARNKAGRGGWVHRTLRATAEASQADLVALLAERGVAYEPYWISNTVWVRGDRALVDELVALPEVSGIVADRKLPLHQPVTAHVTRPVTAPAVPQAHLPSEDPAVEWNISRIRADEVWRNFGVRGEGITIGVIDAGATFEHPALRAQYRGNRADGVIDHNYNWRPIGGCATPCDTTTLIGHGSRVTGIAVGDGGPGNRIGVAPGARWIASAACDDGGCPLSALLRSGEWMLAPTNLNGENPRPDLAPDIVNNSWGGDGGDPFYQDIVDAWVAAGIFPVFSVGNDGPVCHSAASPADYPSSYAVGAHERLDNRIASFSSRGFSTMDGAPIKPDITAPGVGIRSSNPQRTAGGYEAGSGTSFAAPHVAGTVALLWSSEPRLRGDIEATRWVLGHTARDVADQPDPLQCGGTLDHNNVYGRGLLDAWAAVGLLRVPTTGLLTGQVTSDSDGEPISDAVVTTTPGDAWALTDDDGGFVLRLEPGTYQVTASSDLHADVTVDGVEVRAGQTTPLDLVQAHTFGLLTGQVTSAASGNPLDNAHPFIDILGRVEPGGHTFRPQTEAGRYTQRLAPGTYQVAIDALRFQNVTIPDVVVDPRATTTLDIALEPSTSTGQLRARALTKKGDPVPQGGTATLRDGPDEPMERDLNWDTVEFRQVTPGTWTLEVTKPGCRPFSTQVRIWPSEQANPEVVLTGCKNRKDRSEPHLATRGL